MAHVSFIVVFGTRWTFKPVPDGWDGKLNCPDCARPTRMVEQHAIKAFTLYWMALKRLEDGGHLLECRECFSRFELPPELLDEGSIEDAGVEDGDVEKAAAPVES